MRLLFGIAFLLCIQLNLNAQNNFVRISGKVVGANSSENIAYATVGVLNQPIGTASNLDGEFDLYIPSNLIVDGMLKVTFIGYHSFEKPLSEIDTANVLNIRLKGKNIQLDDLTVFDEKLSVEDLLTRAFGAVHDNYPDNPYMLQTFYRHYCKEDTAYGRLIEAAVDVYDSKGHKRFYTHPKHKLEVRVNEIRRSYDFTKNFDEHDPISIYSTLAYDFTSYESFIHAVPEEYNFKIVDTTFYDGHFVYVVQYHTTFSDEKDDDKYASEITGEIYISVDNFAVFKLAEKSTNTLSKTYEEHLLTKEWAVIFKEFDGNYYMNYAMESGYNKDQLFDNDHKEVSNKDHFFHVEMMTNNVIVDCEPFKGKEPNEDELAEVGYSAAFWKNYTILKHTPLNQKVIDDLEREQSLQDQFKDNN